MKIRTFTCLLALVVVGDLISCRRVPAALRPGLGEDPGGRRGKQ